MASPSIKTCLSSADGYRIWARSYDHELNPMLSLEKRFLEPLLPNVAGLDVSDLGCGTGRWLEILKDSRPRSLFGVDSSPEMLRVARSKLGPAARFLKADCSSARLGSACADLILCNFLLSYIEDASSFLTNARTMLRDGGSLFLTDLHPETAAKLNWRRGVQLENEFSEIRTYQRSIDLVLALCESANLQAVVRLETPFGDQEKLIFEAAGKRDYFKETKAYPAIYILQLCPTRSCRPVAVGENSPDIVRAIHGARLAVGPQTSLPLEIRINDSQISLISSLDGAPYKDQAALSPEPSIDLTGFLLLPGLVNAHDHLEFALFPRLGRGGYKNALEWAEDIHHPGASPIAEHRSVPRDVRLRWGGIRNLLCGVTTVCHHNPYEAAVFDKDFVVRVVRDYGWAHSIPMDPQVAHKKRQTANGRPFLVHLAEGIDEQSAEEIFELHRSGALDENTVIIHGLALGEKGAALLRAACAGLVWCPSSNEFLFGKTLSPAEIRSFPKLALGSDSPLTARGDLLDELRFAHEATGLSADELYGHVTHQPAQLLQLRNGEGTARTGAYADLIAVPDTGRSSSDTLSALSYLDIELVLLGGRVQLTSDEMRQRLPHSLCSGLQPLLIEGTVRWVRAPLARMFEETTACLRGDIFLGGKQVNLGA
jgi:cytosine/adenosine deaminase-related metal-dependent hydrolase/SAM-dependent methyltransferase